METCGVQDPRLDFWYGQGLTDGAESFGFEGYLGWRELTYRDSSVGFGREFSPFIRAFRGVRGDVPPAGLYVLGGVLEV